jgi:hypothetical protein
MKPLMMAALVIQLTSAGGAGSGRAGEGSQSGSTAKDVRKHFSALKNEMSSLTQQFHVARERARLDAERRKQESEGSYGPQLERAAAAPATAEGSSR